MTKKILLIDDDPDILALLDIVFQDSGYEVILSRTILDASYIGIIHPDLILLDVRIVGSKKTGADICRELKGNKETAALPVILLSAESGLEALARECQANSYISKPFAIQDLLQEVKRQLLTN